MKIIKLISITSLSLLFLTNNTSAQSTASATAEGTIVAPIAITKVQDMAFGNVAVSASSGTVQLRALGLRQTTGGATLPSTTGTFHQAIFNIAGQASYTYAVTLPSSPITVTHTNNTDVMTIDVNSSKVASTNIGSPFLDGSGNDVLNVGGLLSVAGSQLPGVYTSLTGFDVTVNYN